MEAMEAKLSETGCCIELLVPLAQGLAKQPLTSVPVRYVRPELELQFTSNTCSSRLPQAPVIDMIKLLSSDCHVSELHKLDYACKHWGFFQLINHGVSPSLVESVKKGVEEFFNILMEEKTKFNRE
ncbi:protein SRG1-like isoform X2 [Prosopis cineraria]|uniref:protein SRG1-like isoform X2 n=1 Tax=Prosopis cineraria TaxID=364024 RepID=UPI0024101130|nr:protein SRG1-like isoform X2 [Prosopis cineraria]